MGSRPHCLLGRELNCKISEIELEDMNFGDGAPSVNAQMSLSFSFKYAE